MKLVTNRRSNLLLALIFAVAIGLAGTLLAGNVERVYAVSCGTDYITNYTCDWSYDWIEMDTQACPSTIYLMRKTFDRYYVLSNPISDQYQNTFQAYDCAPVNYNCPSYCN